MAFVNMGELLKRAREFEERLERYYAAIRDESGDNGVRLLTYYLSKHRRHLEGALEGLDSNAIDHINKVRLKYDINFYPEKVFQAIPAAPSEVNGNTLLEAAVGYDQELVKLYKQMLEHSLSEESRVFIETLIRTEEKDIVMLKKMIAMNYF
jgi:rubrerythrin